MVARLRYGEEDTTKAVTIQDVQAATTATAQALTVLKELHAKATEENISVWNDDRYFHYHVPIDCTTKKKNHFYCKKILFFI